MNDKMTDSYKKETEEFKKWSDNGSERINDSKSGVSLRPRLNELMNLQCLQH